MLNMDRRYLDRKEFVKYHAFRELLELSCQLLDWRTAVSAADSIAPEKAEWPAESPFAQNSTIATPTAYATM